MVVPTPIQAGFCDFRGLGIEQLTPQSPGVYCESLEDVGVKIRMEGKRKTSASCGYRRDNRFSALEFYLTVSITAYAMSAFSEIKLGTPYTTPLWLIGSSHDRVFKGTRVRFSLGPLCFWITLPLIKGFNSHLG